MSTSHRCFIFNYFCPKFQLLERGKMLNFTLDYTIAMNQGDLLHLCTQSSHTTAEIPKDANIFRTHNIGF